MNQPQEINVTLQSPVSDVAFGSFTAPTDILFGRDGNDIFQGFAPANNDRIKPDIDIFVGDLFDNTVPEYLLILAIQGKLDPRLPPDQFAILNPKTLDPLGLPTPTPSSAGSLGADRFLLGDVSGPYYTNNPFSRIINGDPFGIDQFALIYDFDPSSDTIQLNGKKSDYFVLEIDKLEDPSYGPTPFSGQAIFSLQEGLPDLVGLVVSPPEVNLDLNAGYFRFVGNKPSKKPSNKRIAPLSTEGIDTGTGVAVDASGNIYVTGSTSGNLFGTSKGFTDAFVAKYDTNANQVSGRQIGTAGDDRAVRVVTDAQGNYYLAGNTDSNLFGKPNSNEEAWVAKYNKDGGFQWGRQFALPGAFATGGFGLGVDNSGNVFLSGLGIKENTNPALQFPSEDDSWVVKYNSDGELQWTTEIDTIGFHENYNLAVDNSKKSNYEGSVYLTGWTQGFIKEADPNRAPLKYDAWLAKVDNSTGEVKWTQQLSSEDEGLDFIQGIDTDSQGNIYISGWTSGLVGTQVGERDLFIAKFDPEAGTLLKAIQFGSVKDDGQFFGNLTIDENDQIYVTGHTNAKTGKDGGKADPAFDALVGKFDTELNNLWLRRFGSNNLYDNATGIDVSGGQVYVTGFSERFIGQTGGGSFDAWIAQLNANNGKLQKFSGNGATSVDFEAAESASITDITSSLETKEELPQGDFKIDPTGGRSTGQLDYGDFLQGFGKAVDPTADNSVQSALMDAIMNDDLSVFGDNVQGLNLEGTDGNDSLMGLVGDDKIKGKAGDDTLSGLAGNDELEGDKGKDRLTGVNPDAAQAGSGELDKLKGGAGEDLFVLGDTQKAYYLGQLNSDYALIEDFKLNQLDKIQLHGSAGDYRIDTDLSGLPTGDAIVSSATNDLISIVKDVKGLSLTDQNVFTFA
jgi:hypothetical protein